MVAGRSGTFRFDFNALFGLMILSLPLSVKLFFPPLQTEIIYPAEILIGVIAIMFIYTLLFKKENNFIPDKKFLKHPLTLLVFLYIAVHIISAVFSTMYLVSFKSLTVKICYVVVFYFIAYTFIRTSLSGFADMIKLYGVSLLLVAVFSLAGHYQFGFTRGSSSFISYPFYTDHTIYAAALAFILPAFISFSFFSKELNIGSLKQIAFILSALLITVALYFSFSRAARISIIAVLLLWLLMILRVRFYLLVSLISIAALLLFFNRHAVMESFRKNRVNSNEIGAGLYEHIFSLTNITSDLSNAERINRWKCALRMFFDKPLLGFGPGTYQFQYFQYQKTEEMTPVSIQEPIRPGATTYSWSPQNGITLARNASAFQGNGGSAHSEYFLALSETGIFSLIVFIGLLLVSLKTGMRIFAQQRDKTIKIIALFAMFGLATYFVHGLFNNFLDDAKLAFLFWSSVSALAAADSVSSPEIEFNIS